MKAQYWAYRDRKTRKRNFRNLWILRINAACRQLGTTYSRFIEGLAAAQIEIDRRMLAELAVNDSAAFKAIVDKAVTALDQKKAA
jgi:large subunit ribosomal protein L20